MLPKGSDLIFDPRHNAAERACRWRSWATAATRISPSGLVVVVASRRGVPVWRSRVPEADCGLPGEDGDGG